MSRRPARNLIVGLDIGTSKVVDIVGEIRDDGEIEVIGIGSHPSRGLKKGVVEMTGSEVKIEVTLGMMAKMLKGTIMKEIDSKLAKVLAP